MTTLKKATAELWEFPLSGPTGGSGITAVDVIVVDLEDSDGVTGTGFSYVLGGGGKNRNPCGPGYAVALCRRAGDRAAPGAVAAPGGVAQPVGAGCRLSVDRRDRCCHVGSVCEETGDAPVSGAWRRCEDPARIWLGRFRPDAGPRCGGRAVARICRDGMHGP